MQFDLSGDLKLTERNSLDEPVRNSSQTTVQREGNGIVGTTIEYGYDSNVQYDFVVVGSGAGYDQPESNQCHHSANVNLVEVLSRPVLPSLVIGYSSLKQEVMPATISRRRCLR